MKHWSLQIEIGTDDGYRPEQLRRVDPDQERERRRRKWERIESEEPALAALLVDLKVAGMAPSEPLMRKK